MDLNIMYGQQIKIADRKSSCVPSILRVSWVSPNFHSPDDSRASLKFAIIVLVMATRVHDTRHLISSTDYAMLHCVRQSKNVIYIYIFPLLLWFSAMSATCLSTHNHKSTQIWWHIRNTCRSRFHSQVCGTNERWKCVWLTEGLFSGLLMSRILFHMTYEWVATR